MKIRLAQLGVALAVFAVMWALLVAVGKYVGGVELLIWLALLVTAEIAAVRWVGRRFRARTDAPTP